VYIFKAERDKQIIRIPKVHFRINRCYVSRAASYVKNSTLITSPAASCHAPFIDRTSDWMHLARLMAVCFSNISARFSNIDALYRHVNYNATTIVILELQELRGRAR